MNKEYFKIKDKCRKGLLKYLSKATSSLPEIKNPRILDVGCGSGIPTLLMAEIFNGKITAIDPDTNSIDYLTTKIKELNLSERISTSNCSLFDNEVKNNQYDIVLAEGLLNVVGFQKGFLRITELLKRKGFIIIHDEFKDQNEKMELIKNSGFRILDSFVLDEQIWWNDFFRCLEIEISFITNKELLKLFKSDLNEIELFKKDPSPYNSVYFIIEKI